MKHNIATPLLLTLALSACGGSGSDSNNNNGGNNDDNPGGTFSGVPYDYPRYQDALDNANLQVSDNPETAGSSKSDVVDAGEYDGYESEHFYIDTSSGNLTFAMSNDKNRAELRFTENFLTNLADTQYTLSAEVMPIDPTGSVANSNDGQEITLLQVHNKGTAGETDNSVLSHPLLRVVWDGESRKDDNTKTSYSGAYWAIIKTNAFECSNEDGENYRPDCPDSYDNYYLGEFNEGDFTKFDIIVREGQLIINVDGEEKVDYNIDYWSELYSYFKAGVYNQYEDGNSVVEFKSITYNDLETDLDPSLAPSDNFDLSKWNLSVPIEDLDDEDGEDGEDGDALTIDVDDLNDGYDDGEYFTTGTDGGMIFMARNEGAKTSSGTSYTRSELREMLDTSAKTTAVSKNNWVFSSAPESEQKKSGGVDGVLEATLAVNEVTTLGESSKLGRVVIGQIHATDDEPIRLYYRKLPGNNKGSVYFAHEPNKDAFPDCDFDKDYDDLSEFCKKGDEVWIDMIGSKSSTADDDDVSDGIALNEKFSYQIKVVGDELTVTIKRDGKSDVIKTHDMSASGYDREGQYMYFKAGVYNQNKLVDSNDYDSGADPEEFVQATFYSLTHSHDDAPE